MKSNAPPINPSSNNYNRVTTVLDNKNASQHSSRAKISEQNIPSVSPIKQIINPITPKPTTINFISPLNQSSLNQKMPK